jgi:glutaredoxin 3
VENNGMTVVIYASHFCPYCIRAKQLLEKKGVAFEEINVDGHPELRAEMTARSGQTSVPQIWIGAVHVGGCDDLHALERQGELDTLLAAVHNV